MRLFLFAFSSFLICSIGLIGRADAQTDVVAFWHFEGFDVRDELDLIPEDIAGRIEVEADVDNTARPHSTATEAVALSPTLLR